MAYVEKHSGSVLGDPRAVASSYATQPPRVESRLDGIDKRLNDSVARLATLFGRTNAMADRLVGVQPQEAQRTGVAPKETPTHAARRLELTCDELNIVIAALSEQIERIESL